MAQDRAGRSPDRDRAGHGPEPSDLPDPSAAPGGGGGGADDDGGDEARPESAEQRRRRLRHRLTQALAIVVILAVFGLIFPRIASYSAAWDVVRSMTANWILVLIGLTVANLIVQWWFITTCLPGLSMPRAAAMNLSSTAVANTVPVGGAIALGVSWNMASAWGFSGETFTLYTLVSGLWSQFAKFGTPAVALIALVSVGSANRSLVLATVLGTGVFLLALGLVIAALHSDSFMSTLGRFTQRVLDRVMGWFHRRGPRDVEQGFLQLQAPRGGPDQDARLADQPVHARQRHRRLDRAAGLPARLRGELRRGVVAEVVRGLRADPAADHDPDHPGRTSASPRSA